MIGPEVTWDALLQDAAVAGIPVHERSLAAGEVQAALVSGRYLAIALVDKCTLGLGPPQSWADAVSPDAPGEVAYVGEAQQLPHIVSAAHAPLLCATGRFCASHYAALALPGVLF